MADNPRWDQPRKLPEPDWQWLVREPRVQALFASEPWQALLRDYQRMLESAGDLQTLGRAQEGLKALRSAANLAQRQLEIAERKNKARDEEDARSVNPVLRMLRRAGTL